MVSWQLRLRAVLTKQYAVVLAVVLVFMLLGGWMTYSAYVSPGETETEEEVTMWELDGEFTHGATVETDNPVFTQGTRLSDRSVYFTRLSPELDGSFNTSYTARESGNLDQTVSLSMVMRAVEQQDEQTTVHWETHTELDNTTVEAVEPGEQVQVTFSENMSAAESELTNISEEIGGTPGETELFIQATVSSQGTINGEMIDKTETYTLPVTFENSIYRVGGAEPTTKSYETTHTVSVQERPGLIPRIGGPLLLVVSLGGVGLITTTRREPLTERKQVELTYRDDRETFDEWISKIQLPEEAFDLPRASAASLGDLVDFAIDTDNSVIEDPDEEAYYVCHDGYLYTYAPSFDSGAVENEDIDEEES